MSYHLDENPNIRLLSSALPSYQEPDFTLIYRDVDLPLIVAIDLQPMAPIEGVIQVQGDITNARTAEAVRMLFLQFMASQCSNLSTSK